MSRPRDVPRTTALTSRRASATVRSRSRMTTSPELTRRPLFVAALFVSMLVACVGRPLQEPAPAAAAVIAADPLPSWNDGMARRAIVAFVERVTKEGSPDFVPPAERIATFDNDGTLWAEKPAPTQ